MNRAIRYTEAEKTGQQQHLHGITDEGGRGEKEKVRKEMKRIELPNNRTPPTLMATTIPEMSS